MKTFLTASSWLFMSMMPYAGSASELKPAEAGPFVVDLLPGHSVYHEREQEAGVIMAISITPGQHNTAELTSLCEDLRSAAGLEHRTSRGLVLEVLFVVPYKDMAIEGYYFPADDGPGREKLVPGHGLAREALDEIVGRAGIPAGILDETDVEQEVSCEVHEPAWHVRWEDVHPVGGEDPDAVIERARSRFMTIHQDMIDQSGNTSLSAILQ